MIRCIRKGDNGVSRIVIGILGRIYQNSAHTQALCIAVYICGLLLNNCIDACAVCIVFRAVCSMYRVEINSCLRERSFFLLITCGCRPVMGTSQESEAQCRRTREPEKNKIPWGPPSLEKTTKKLKYKKQLVPPYLVRRDCTG